MSAFFKTTGVILLFILFHACGLPNKREAVSTTHTKVDTLLNRMTLPEKIAQLQGAWLKDLLNGRKVSLDSCRKKIPNGIGYFAQFAASTDLSPEELRQAVRDIQKYLEEETNSGIRAIFSEEAISGFSAKGATTLPQQIGIGCTWNPRLLKENSTMTARLLRQVGATQVLSPMLDICRDPHWGRIEESFGEEPYLIARMGVAFVEGIQGENLENGVVATTKHFAGYGKGISNQKEFNEETLLPHEAAIRFGNAQSVMAGYHTINGIPCSANKPLLTGLLRNQWGFEGVVISDFWSVKQVYTQYQYATNDQDAGIKALEAGLDVELPFGMSFPLLANAVEQGTINEAIIDHAVRRVLALKVKLGLLGTSHTATTDSLNLDPPENRQRAYTSACESVVLLKNNGILPLSPSVKQIAVVGPNANAVEALLGDYTYQALAAYWWKIPIDRTRPKLITLLDGLRNRVSKDVKVVYERGCSWTTSDKNETENAGPIGDERSKQTENPLYNGFSLPDMQKALSLAKKSDVIIAAMGEQFYLVGEGRNRKDIKLPGEQEQFVKQLINTGRPVVLVIFGGRPQIITNIAPGCAAVMHAWFPGEEGGHAVADLLLGNVNPSGKLTLTYPKINTQKSLRYSAGYDDTNPPMYPFGFGLSYTSFSYKHLKIPKSTTVDDQWIELSFEIQNTGSVAGAEIAQLYISPPNGHKGLEPIELKGFAKTNIPAGKSKTVTFALAKEQLAYYQDGMWVIDPGIYHFKIGSSCTDIRLAKEVALVGNKIALKQRKNLFSKVNIY